MKAERRVGAVHHGEGARGAAARRPIGKRGVGQAGLLGAGRGVSLRPPMGGDRGGGRVGACVMDVAIAAFCVAYAFCGSRAYGGAFPLPGWAGAAAAPLR